jgi:hypothetical protein
VTACFLVMNLKKSRHSNSYRSHCMSAGHDRKSTGVKTGAACQTSCALPESTVLHALSCACLRSAQ